MKALKKLISIVMVALVLISSTGITVYSHHCTMSGKTKLSLHPIASCCGKVNMPKGCCKDGIKILKSDISSTSPSFQKNIVPDFIFTVPLFEHCLFITTTSDFSSYLIYRPPLIPPDINVLVECFRI